MVIPVEVQMGKMFPEYISVNGFPLTVVDIKESIRTGPIGAGFDHYYAKLDDDEIGWISLDCSNGQWYWEPD
jgi:hypothetical protein